MEVTRDDIVSNVALGRGGTPQEVDETRSYYRITEKRLVYLSGELDREELVESKPTSKTILGPRRASQTEEQGRSTR